MSDESGGGIKLFGLKLPPHVFYMIVGLGGLALLFLLGKGCSCVYGLFKPRVQKIQRQQAARDQLANVKNLMERLEDAVAKNADTVPSLVNEVDRELGIAKIRDPNLADRPEFKQIVGRLDKIKTQAPKPQEKKGADDKKGGPK